MSAIKPRAGAPGYGGTGVSPGLGLCRGTGSAGVQCASAVGSQLASPHAGRDGGFGLWHLLVFSELWVRIAGWELVTPH